MQRFGLLVICLALVAVNISYAGVYKWVDEDGQVHFGDNPQGTSKSERVKIRKAPPPDPSTLERLNSREKFLDAKEKERANEQDTLEKAEKKKAAYKEFCEKTRERLTMLERGGRLYAVETSGEKNYLTEEDRQAEIALAKEDLKKHCQ